MKTTKDKKSNIHLAHRKRMKDKFLKNKLNGFSEHEILEFLLFFAKPQGDTNALAHNLINKFGSLNKVLDANFDDLIETSGVGEHTAILLTLIPHLFKEYQSGKVDFRAPLTTYRDCYNLASNLFLNSCTEELYVVCITSNNTIINQKLISQGNIDKVDVNIREITNFILRNNCSRILIYHNHPSEVLEFSDADIQLTAAIYNACLLNETDVVDHILYTHLGCKSLHKDGVLDKIKKEIMDMLNIKQESLVYKKLYCASNVMEIKD